MALSPALLKGQSELIGTVVYDGPMAHGSHCAWKPYGVRREGDHEGLFWLRYDTCGQKPSGEWRKLIPGVTYRFALGPPSERSPDQLQILDAVVVSGGPEPLPACAENTARSLALAGTAQDQLQKRFGPPDQTFSHLAGEKGGEFYSYMRQRHPASVPAVADEALQQWNWSEGDCVLSVWFHLSAGQWQVLYAYYWNERMTL